MNVLVDTNVVIRLLNHDDPQHDLAYAALEALKKKNCRLMISPQVAFEWWAVATRPKEANGQGLSVAQSDVALTGLLATFPVVEDPPQLVERWRALVVSHEVKGKHTHDARLYVAAALSGFDALLTFNVDDFKRFSGLTLLNPITVTAPSGAK